MASATCAHPCATGPKGLARVTSSLWEKSFLAGSGFPFMNSSSFSLRPAIILRYSPECVEGEFCELRMYGVLESSYMALCIAPVRHESVYGDSDRGYAQIPK